MSDDVYRYRGEVPKRPRQREKEAEIQRAIRREARRVSRRKAILRAAHA